MGSVQRLWNDNTFICESAFGRLFEVTPEAETVWEYVIPDFGEYPDPLNKFITGKHNSCFKCTSLSRRNVMILLSGNSNQLLANHISNHAFLKLT